MKLVTTKSHLIGGLAISDKFLYSFYGDGIETWVYRCSESGDIVRAKISDNHYSYFDLAELPIRVAYEFKHAAQRKWNPNVPESTLLTTEVQENDSDEGMSDEDFIDYVVNRHRNVKFEDHKFWMLIEDQDFKRRYIEMPHSMLRSIAKRCGYFGNAIWMVE